MVKVSVIMSVYNGNGFLKDAIKSILNQTFTDFEFIIIDDGSSEPIKELVDSFKDDRIKLIINNTNMGLTASLNNGLFIAQGEHIARQDADDISERTRLFKQADYLDTNQEIGLVGSSCLIIDEVGSIIDDWEATPNPTKSLSTRNKITHGSVMFRRSVMENIGKYDEHFKYSQDYEYWLRISKKYQIRNMPDRLYRSRIHKKMLSVTKTEQQALYVILAQRKAAGCTSLQPLEYSDLTRDEKIRYHNMVAYSYVQSDNMTKAKEEFSNLIKLAPFHLENDVRIVASLINGRNGINWVQKLYRGIRKKIQT